MVLCHRALATECHFYFIFCMCIHNGCWQTTTTVAMKQIQLRLHVCLVFGVKGCCVFTERWTHDNHQHWIEVNSTRIRLKKKHHKNEQKKKNKSYFAEKVPISWSISLLWSGILPEQHLVERKTHVVARFHSIAFYELIFLYLKNLSMLFFILTLKHME